MSVKSKSYKDLKPYYYYGKVVDCSDVEAKGFEIKTFDNRLYVNFGNGFCIKRNKNFRCDVNVQESVSLQVVPIAMIFDKIKWVNNSNGDKIFGRSHSSESLVKMTMVKK
ncbi:hypothetical protein RW115_12075 [Macrococcus capreoli]